MEQETEAAALLRSGNLFPRRVGLRRSNGALTFVGVKHGAFAIYEGDQPYAHFDLEGRWQRAFRDGTHFRKGLDGSVDAIDRNRDGANMVLRRRSLRVEETTQLDDIIRQAALNLAADLSVGQFEVVPPPDSNRHLEPADLCSLLDLIAGWDANAWSSLRSRYVETYGPIGLLPPDAHNSVVLQATTGDAGEWGFGGAAPRAHDVRSLEAFESHVQAVKSLLGRRMAQCRAVFLGGADVLRLPFDHVLGLFETIPRHLPINPTAASIRLGAATRGRLSTRGDRRFSRRLSRPAPRP